MSFSIPVIYSRKEPSFYSSKTAADKLDVQRMQLYLSYLLAIDNRSNLFLIFRFNETNQICLHQKIISKRK